MKSKLPLRNLCLLTVWLSLTSAVFVFLMIFLSAKVGDYRRAILYSLLAFFILSETGFANIGIFKILNGKFLRHSVAFKGRMFFYSFVLNFIMSMLATLLCTYYDNWLSEVVKPGSILVLSFLILIYISLQLTLQSYVILREEKANSDLENSNLKTANIEAANLLLRQQIHPHFLFNALNTLKSLYKKDPVTAEDYLLRLSDFLRASVSNNNIKVILLKDEIKLCTDYLEMQKIRFGQALEYSVKITDEKQGNGYVPSFSIQPLVENAIKHNEITEESPLIISIRQEGEWINVINNLQIKKISERATEVGLSNLAERYRLLSGDELIIDKTNDFFSVKIKILSNENSNYRR